MHYIKEGNVATAVSGSEWELVRTNALKLSIWVEMIINF